MKVSKDLPNENAPEYTNEIFFESDIDDEYYFAPRGSRTNVKSTRHCSADKRNQNLEQELNPLPAETNSIFNLDVIKDSNVASFGKTLLRYGDDSIPRAVAQQQVTTCCPFSMEL